MAKDVKNKILSSLESFSKDWAPLVYPKARMVIRLDNLPIAFETMMFGRFNQDNVCFYCNRPDLCQEGPYALRISSSGKLRGCLLSSKSIDLLEALKSGYSDEQLINLYKSGYDLLP